jgi:TIR domain-containing protein
MPGKIFISYRRGDDPGSAGRLLDALKLAFDADQLFIDVDNIEPGLDFIQVIHERVAQSDILLAVIGKYWCDAREADGSRRLDNPSDIVRIEIESALSQKKRVIPVLVGDTKIPPPDSLPESLRPLSRRNAVQIRHERFGDDTARLTAALKIALRSSSGGDGDAPPEGADQARSRAFVDTLIANRRLTPSLGLGVFAIIFLLTAITYYFASSFGNPRQFALQAESVPKFVPSSWSQPRWCLEQNLKPDELRICSSPSLWALDVKLNEIFTNVLAASDPEKRRSVTQDEMAWLKDTRGACVQDENCILRVYRDRIAYFSKAKE